jgi:hypothetical protein
VQARYRTEYAVVIVLGGVGNSPGALGSKQPNQDEDYGHLVGELGYAGAGRTASAGQVKPGVL